ncbi:tRNA1(Val) (adenine(37)-N6)-methyltransferase [Bacillus sp. FJAT-45037]|uniref:tRNA1(Val) (adenine(37)-N6)-methyltransferase n=1 Tax=Bacillus sp. FJAT-45037 TaxID=2011007 RepID=UPI000C2376C1|nr:tRNA1(Val) (adenine(37)-N6)-methyltransferase [Bacillus sp. FJAT-45037]
MEKIYKDERLDFIKGTELKVIQSPSVFSFSIDAILLARFVYLPIQKGAVLDLCTGNGVIPLVMSTRSKALITGVELQERLYDMAKRNAELNQLHEQVQFIQADLNKMPNSVNKDGYDVVTCNPPYFETITKEERNKNIHLAIARHEIHCTLDDVIRTCSQYVKQKGKVALVHRPERLTDMMSLMRKYRIEPKRLQFVHPKKEKEANMVLLEGIKDGRSGLTCLPPLIVYQEDGTYTNEFEEVYIGQ